MPAPRERSGLGPQTSHRAQKSLDAPLKSLGKIAKSAKLFAGSDWTRHFLTLFLSLVPCHPGHPLPPRLVPPQSMFYGLASVHKELAGQVEILSILLKRSSQWFTSFFQTMLLCLRQTSPQWEESLENLASLCLIDLPPTMGNGCGTEKPGRPYPQHIIARFAMVQASARPLVLVGVRT